jgi:sugar transferase (PEP-CTERM/EpsH1 system associated)
MRDGCAPLVVHVVHSFGTGGLENGMVNIINRTPPQRYRHAIVCLTSASAFAGRLRAPGVRILELGKGEGHSFSIYWQLWRVLYDLRPALIHTRNLAALEAQVPALLVPGARRVHGEHGRDMFDLHGANRKYNLLRRLIRPLVQRYITVSRDLEQWLQATVGAAPGRIRQIYNGVDRSLFFPRRGARPGLAPPGFLPPDALVIGTVGRLAGVKDQVTLARAFARLVRETPEASERARLVIAGDGPDMARLRATVEEEGIAHLTWLAGERADVPDIMRLLDVFVLPSLGEGISNTILEAMASALPVVATRVGGNPELVADGENGLLVPAGEPRAMATALASYLRDPGLARRHGGAGLERVERTFNWERCVESYLAVYDELLGRTA